jgi:hypothetical protein
MFDKEYKLWSSLYIFLCSPVTFFFLDLNVNILPSTLFWSTLYQCYFLMVVYQVPRSYKTTGLIGVDVLFNSQMSSLQFVEPYLHEQTDKQTHRQTAERAARVSADAQSSPDRILKSSDVTRLIHDPISNLMESSGCRWEVAAECKTFKPCLNHSYQKLCIYLTLCRFKDLSSTFIFSDCHHMIQMNPVLELT